MDLTKLVSKSKTPSVATATNQLAKYTAKAAKPMDLYNNALTEYGVPDARNTVTSSRQAMSDTQALIDAVDPSVTGRTSDSLVTEAKRQGLVAKERVPHYDALKVQTNAYNTASANLADLLGQAQNAAQLGWQGTQADLAALNQRIASAQWAEGQKAAKAAAAQSPYDPFAGLLNSGNGITYNEGGYGYKQRKKDKGFNFYDPQGNPISAATYAVNSGYNQNWRALLQTMANAGDTGAQAALGFVGDDFGYDPSKVRFKPKLGQIYNALTWGSPYVTPYQLPSGLKVG